MKVNDKLLELTNKFLKEFLDACAEQDDRERDDLFHFNFTLADAIAQSNYPRYKEQTTLLMGMASFDDSIAKAFFNNRCQGFVAAIEERIAYTAEQEDYLVKNVKCEEYLKDDFDFEWFTTETGERSFKKVPCKTKVQKITFDVSNNRSGFKGNAIIYKEWDKEFFNKNEFVEKFITEKVDFFCKKDRIMSIDLRFDFKTYKYYEEATFTHYKHIADINSFFLVLGLT
jgi:hypothetical protein